jgi:hypothetical protein
MAPTSIGHEDRGSEVNGPGGSDAARYDVALAAWATVSTL